MKIHELEQLRELIKKGWKLRLDGGERGNGWGSEANDTSLNQIGLKEGRYYLKSPQADIIRVEYSSNGRLDDNNFNYGDKVRCKPGYNKGKGNSYDAPDCGGGGYEEGLVFTVHRISRGANNRRIVWGKDSLGVYARSLELVLRKKDIEPDPKEDGAIKEADLDIELSIFKEGSWFTYGSSTFCIREVDRDNKKIFYHSCHDTESNIQGPTGSFQFGSMWFDGCATATQYEIADAIDANTIVTPTLRVVDPWVFAYEEEVKHHGKGLRENIGSSLQPASEDNNSKHQEHGCKSDKDKQIDDNLDTYFRGKRNERARDSVSKIESIIKEDYR